MDQASVARRLFVLEDIHDRMVANAVPQMFPSVNLETLTTLFWSGQYISVSMLGDPKGRHPNFEKLHTVDEMWAMCFRSPKQNQWRLFGRFMQKNHFFGIALFPRNELGSVKNYNEKAHEAAFQWDRMLPGAPVVRSQVKESYLSGVVKDVDVDPI